MTGEYRNIVITGATGGIGRAVAVELARPGHRFLLFGRDEARLAEVVTKVRAKGAEAVAANVPVEEAGEVARAIDAFDAAHPIDLLLTCAGVKCGNEAGIEAAEQARRVMEVNVIGTIDTVEACLCHMVPRGRGRVALFSSLAAFAPQPDLLSYSASKAAIRSYGIALRRNLRRTGIGVTVVLPGFVDTEMTRRHVGPTPQKMNAEWAARIIARGLMRGRNTVAFPRMLALLSRLEGLVPAMLSDRAHDRLRATIIPDEDEAKVYNAQERQ